MMRRAADDDACDSMIKQLQSNLTEEELFKCANCLYNIWITFYKNTVPNKEYIIHLNEINSNMKFSKVKFKIMDILESK